MQRELDEATSILEEVERLARVGSWRVDLTRGVILASKEWQRIHGLHGDVLRLEQFASLCDPEDAAWVFAEMARVAKTGDRCEIELCIMQHDTGAARNIVIYGRAATDDHTTMSVQGAVVDVTDRVQALEELKEKEERLKRALGGTVAALSSTVEMRDPYTAGHQRRTTELAAAIACELGWGQEAKATLRTAATVHDIGKISVPAEILSKPGRLSAAEFLLIKSHPTVAHDILAPIDFGAPIAEVVFQHHERLDGSGYPRALEGVRILPAAQVLAIADVVEAMVTHRPYRPALPAQEAILEIRSGLGTRYDGDAGEACLALLERGFDFPE